MNIVEKIQEAIGLMRLRFHYRVRFYYKNLMCFIGVCPHCHSKLSYTTLGNPVCFACEERPL